MKERKRRGEGEGRKREERDVGRRISERKRRERKGEEIGVWMHGWIDRYIQDYYGYRVKGMPPATYFL